MRRDKSSTILWCTRGNSRSCLTWQWEGRQRGRWEVAMRLRLMLIVSGAGVAIVLAQIAAGPLRAQAGSQVALTGRVTSAEDGPLEGVLISAKKAGSTITVTVVTDQQGQYRFPRARLEPGQYALRIRAAGYDLDGTATADVAGNKTTKVDLTVR